jgi:hypothetical protein
MTQEVQKIPQAESVFMSAKSFADAKEMATGLAKSTLVPEAYQNNVDNVMVALELSHRMQMGVFAVMQNLDVVKGTPRFRDQFAIALVNASPKFDRLRYEWVQLGENCPDKNHDNYGCRGWAKDPKTGEKFFGPWITWKLVRKNGWDKMLDKKGQNHSKWMSMPELKFTYRAGAWFLRLHAPEMLQGFYSESEGADIEANTATMDITHEEVSEAKENKNIHHWIATAESLEKLEQVKDHLNGDPELVKAYNTMKLKLEGNG